MPAARAGAWARTKRCCLSRPAGTPLIAHVVHRLAPLAAEQIVVVTNDPDLPARAQLPPATRFLVDAWPDAGTLGGIATGLAAAPGWAIVVACDLPLVNAALFRALRVIAQEAEADQECWDAVVPVVGGYEEPLHALYHRRCLPAILARLAQGQRRVISFMGDVRTCYVQEPCCVLLIRSCARFSMRIRRRSGRRR